MKKSLIILFAAIAVWMFGCSSSQSNSQFESILNNDEPTLTEARDIPSTEFESSEVVNETPQALQSTAIQFSDKPIELTTSSFKERVFDMDQTPSEWVYRGGLPAIVDFYAVWCGPCKMAAPGLEELAKEYAGKVHIFKVDAEKERFLASYFRITGYPTFMVIPAKGQPRIFTGLPQGVRSQGDIKTAFKKIIEEELI